MMIKPTITYRYSKQISPDEFRTFTKVIHFKETDTIKEIFESITKDWPAKKLDVELHCEVIDSRE